MLYKKGDRVVLFGMTTEEFNEKLADSEYTVSLGPAQRANRDVLWDGWGADVDATIVRVCEPTENACQYLVDAPTIWCHNRWVSEFNIKQLVLIVDL